MKIALAQINPTVGDFTGNLDKIVQPAGAPPIRGPASPFSQSSPSAAIRPRTFSRSRAFWLAAGRPSTELACATHELSTAVVAGVALPAPPNAGKPAVNAAVLA